MVVVLPDGAAVDPVPGDDGPVRLDSGDRRTDPAHAGEVPRVLGDGEDEEDVKWKSEQVN